MKIVFASDQYWPIISGVPVSIDIFKKELQNMGDKVFLLAPDYPGAGELDKKMKNDNVYRFRSYSIFFNKENRIVYRSEKKNIYKLLDNIKPDIIHVHSEFTMGHIAGSYAKRNKIPLVITAHTNWEELIALYVPFFPTILARLYCRGRMRREYNKADTVIVPTSLMEILLNLYFVKKPIRIIATGIETKEFHRIKNKKLSEIFTDHPKLKNKKILFFAGRIGKEKNIEFLFDVVERLLEKNSNILLIISGDGPAKEELIQLAKMKKIDNNILFTGFVERKKLKTLYSIADVFVFPSKVESQGLVALESMACGTPVVAIGKMGTRETMSGDFGGFMVDDDLEQFVEKVELLLNNKRVWKNKSNEALSHVEKWAISLMAKKLNNLYLSLIKKFQNK